MHLGHRALIAHLGRGARNEQAAAVAATFDPLPIQVLAPGAPASALSDIHDRVRLLHEAGADAVVVFRFDDAFARLSADEFVDRVKGACDVRRIVVGPDFHFGRRAEAGIEPWTTLWNEGHGKSWRHLVAHAEENRELWRLGLTS